MPRADDLRAGSGEDRDFLFELPRRLRTRAMTGPPRIEPLPAFANPKSEIHNRQCHPEVRHGVSR